ncbi:MAG: FAD-binding oxidoreductase [Actinobacteria bacterium]|nr:FAD-binding oxidoreductase [Actinomycetota bacterium]
MESFDVGIVGAGVHGASAAYHLARRGVRTAVFERWTPAGGPTGRSSGICRAYYTNPFLARVARESIEMLARFPEHTNGRDAGFRRTGFLFLHPQGDVTAVLYGAAALRSVGVDVEVLDMARLEAEFPMLDLEGLGAGVWEEDAGYADPAAATLGLLERAVELGVEPRMGTEIVDLEAAAGGGGVVTTGDGGRTACRRLLVAAGPWTAPLVRRLGVELPLTVERHVVATLAWGRAEPMPFGHADVASGYYCKPEGEDLFCLGSLLPAAEADPDRVLDRITDRETEELSGAVARRVPGLAEAEVRRGWASLYDVSPDWQPVIGEVAPGVFVDAGTSGHGFKLAPVLGRHVADLVTGGPVEPLLAQFHPDRFGTGRPLPAGYGEARILG